MKLWDVFRFEIGHQLRRPSVWLHIVGYLALVFLMVRDMTTGEDGRLLLNSPSQLFEFMSIAGLFGLIVTAALAGDAATRDVRTRMEPLLYTSPVGKGALLGGRFLGVLALNGLLLIGATVMVALAIHTSTVAPGRLGPFRVESYLQPLLIVAFPNAVVAGVLLYVSALLSRRAIASYVAGSLLVVGVFFHLIVTSGLFGLHALAAHLDALGLIATAHLFQTLTPLEKDAMTIPFAGQLLANRLIWLGIAALVGGGAASRFRLAHHAPSAGVRVWFRRPAGSAPSASEQPTSGPVVVPPARRAFGGRARVRQTAAVAGRAFRQLVGGWGGIPLVASALFLVGVGPELMEHLGVPLWPTTARVVDLFAVTGVPSFLTALLIFYAGELVWGDREAGMDALVNVAPVPGGVLLLGQGLGLGLVIVAIQGLQLVAGLTVQALLGYTGVELGLHLGLLFGLQFTDYALIAALALAVHVLVDHKYVGHLVVLAVYVFTLTAPRLGVEHHLLIYGTAPAWVYTELTGFGASLRPFFLFKLYWAGWALLLTAAAWVYRVRGVGEGLRARHRAARHGLTPGMVGLAGAAMAVIVFAGGFVFYNTNRLNPYRSAGEQAARQALYERQYGRYEGAPQPRVAAAALRVELYPARQAATVQGTYRLVNRTGLPIDTLHLATAATVATGPIAFSRAARPVHIDNSLGHRVYRLARPLLPGDTLRMAFNVRYQLRGFTNSGAEATVVARGAFVRMDDWLPRLGYQSNRALTGEQARRQHGLPPRPAAPRLEDPAARLNGQTPLDLDVTIGTAGDQTAVAPGVLRGAWTRDGRRYVRYVSDRPVLDDIPVLSAHYAMREERWESPTAPQRPVLIQVFYQPGRDWNVERFIRAARASLATHTGRLGPYPYRTLKMVAVPDAGMGATAFPGLITYRDGLAAMNPDRDGRDIDFAFAVMAHEVAHQWWGNQLVLAYVEGAPLLNESLAWYSALDVVEARLGGAHLRRLMGVMREAYLVPRAESGVPLLRAVESFDAYRKGPFAMYALRAYLGAARVNGALRRLLERHGERTPPLSTSLDLYRELQAATPDSLHYLLVDLFARNTFWTLEAEGMRVDPTPTGAWRVSLDVRTRKVAVDSAGVTTELPMDDFIEIGVFAEGEGEHGKVLYRRMHRLRSGAQTVTVTVPQRPVRAAIDPRRLLINTLGYSNVADVETAEAGSTWD